MTTPRYEDIRWTCARIVDWQTDCITDLFTVEGQHKALWEVATHILTEFGKGTDHPLYREDQK